MYDAGAARSHPRRCGNLLCEVSFIFFPPEIQNIFFSDFLGGGGKRKASKPLSRYYSVLRLVAKHILLIRGNFSLIHLK